MATLIGNAAKPSGSSGWWEAWSSTYNQAAELLTMPDRGRITSVGFWAAGSNQTASAVACVWDDAGVLLGQSLPVTLANRPPALGNVDLYVLDLITPVERDDGQEFYAGFSRAPTRSHQLTGGGLGLGHHHFDNKRASWPGTMEPNDTGGHGGGDYRIGCHAYYDPISGAWTRRSGAWVRAADVLDRRSGAWPTIEASMIRRSGGWNDAD
jgi:hypothetical protein